MDGIGLLGYIPKSVLPFETRIGMDLVRGMVETFRHERGLENLQDFELFETFAAHCVVSQFLEDEFDPDRLRMGQGGDLGIDARALLINSEMFIDSTEVKSVLSKKRDLDAHLVVIQAKTSPRFEGKVFTEIADNLVQISGPGELTYECSDDVRDLRSAVRALSDDPGRLRDGRPRLSVWYVTSGNWTGEAHLEAKRAAAETRLRATELFRDVRVRAAGESELRMMYRRSTSAVSARLTLNRKVTIPHVPGVKQAFLALVPARELVERLLTGPEGGMRTSVFDENVRAFQEYNDVNKEIRDTLRDEVARRRFAVLNNGITVVARHVATAGDEFDIRDLQIVNGCQTCHVLFDEREHLGADVFVNVRLIESNDEDVISRIVKATNRQSAVSKDDLLAREDFHRSVENYFLHQPEEQRLYYERRSKQYSAARVERLRIITRSQLARAYAAMFIPNLPRVGIYSQLLESHGDHLFQSSHRPQPYYAGAAGYYRLEWLLRRGRIPKIYAPAKFYLLTGIRIKLGGPKAPRDRRSTDAVCHEVLRVMWNVDAAESLISSMIPALHDAAGDEPTLSVACRQPKFGDAFRRSLLSG